MHSIGYLLNEVEDKSNYIKNALLVQNNYQKRLDDNIKEIRADIENSFEKQISGLRLRAQQLLDAADAIYKIKHIASSKRIALLERSSLELKECFDSCYGQTEENGSSQREVIKNILNKIEYPTFDYLDGGLLTWHCDDLQLEEYVKEFGMIDVKNQIEEESENDFELVSPIRPSSSNLDNFLDKEENIEMEVKSIEMYHLTSESASNAEKKDISKIEYEMKDLSLRNKNQENDSFLFLDRSFSSTGNISEREINVQDLSKWLYNVSAKSEALEEIHDVPAKVESWLMNYDESSKHWISSETKKLLNKENVKLRTENSFSEWLAEHDTVSTPTLSSMEKGGSRTPSTTESIAECTNNMWLLKSNKRTSMAEAGVVDSVTNLNKWLESSTSSLASDGSAKISDQPDDSIIVSTGDTDVVAHMQDILRQPVQSFLYRSGDREGERLGKSCDFIDDTISHMKSILSQPTESFLIKGSKTEVPDRSFCEWLVGKSDEKCGTCSGVCAFENDNVRWVKTAIDW